MRVVCLLDEVLQDGSFDNAKLEAELGIDSRLIKKLRKNSSDWRLDAEPFAKLMLFGFEHGLAHGIFAIRPHAVWRTFATTGSALIYRASPVPDAEVEAGLRPFLQRIGCESKTVMVDSPKTADVAEIRKAMRTQNCVFVGSPKSNAASEIALSLLWNAKPFKADTSNKSKLPFQMLVPDAAEPSAIIAPRGSKRAFEIRPTKDASPETIEISWKPQTEYDSSKVEGCDAAIVVVAKSPLETNQDVTTIVISGFTGFSTKAATTQLRMGEPPVSDEEMAKAGTHVLAYKFQYLKPKRTAGSASHDLRREIPGTGKWGPPWSEVCDG